MTKAARLGGLRALFRAAASPPPGPPSPPPPSESLYVVPLVSVTDDGVVSNGPRKYAGFRVPSAVSGTVNVYSGPDATLGDLVHTVTNPVSGTWYYASGVTGITAGVPDTNDRSTWVSCINIWVSQPNQDTDFLTDD